MYYWFVKSFGVKIDHTINKKEPFWKWRIKKHITILRKDISRIDDWFKGRWENGSDKLKCELKRYIYICMYMINCLIET